MIEIQHIFQKDVNRKSIMLLIVIVFNNFKNRIKKYFYAYFKTVHISKA